MIQERAGIFCDKDGRVERQAAPDQRRGFYQGFGDGK